VARRWGEDSLEVVDDLTQETYLKLCVNNGHALRDFASAHQDAIFAFLKVVAASVANDYFKRLQAGKRGGGQVHKPLEGAEPTDSSAGLADHESVERDLLLKEVDRCLCAIAPMATQERDRTIFWLYYRQGMTAREIAQLPSLGLSLKGVESTVYRLTQLVRTHLVKTGRDLE
jgi:RNA polymerase sigma-70 factor (ECF subfamily)